MVAVMAEVVRSRTVAAIADSDFVTLTFDERKPHTVCNYRCLLATIGHCTRDVIPSTGWVNQSDSPMNEPSLGHEGIVGAWCTAVPSLEDLDEDYSLRICDACLALDEVVAAVRNLHKDAHGQVDEQAARNALDKVTSVAVDGAPSMLKTVAYMQRSCPRLVLRWRDAAHAVRLAMQKACQSEPMLAEVRHVLFEKDGGLVPQLKFSNEWKLKLRAISNVVSGNQKLFTQIAWSAVRFDESETLRLFCQMLLPVALLLAGQASDKRISPKLRGLAARTLESMNTDFVVSLGLFADLTHETQRLLRIFDSDWHDPAISRRCLANVRKRVHSLFLEGRILQEGPGLEDTCTCRVVKAALQCGPIYYMDKVHYLWTSRTGRDKYMRGLQGVGQVVEVILERLEAEFPADSLEMAFSCFDVRAAYEASQGSSWQLYEAKVVSQVHRLLREGLRERDCEDTRKTGRFFVSALVQLMPRSKRQAGSSKPSTQSRLNTQLRMQGREDNRALFQVASSWPDATPMFRRLTSFYRWGPQLYKGQLRQQTPADARAAGVCI
ncbi:unnamed protein product [Symbiodinium natans]|uniref:Uncharacterized protein n=1 Tax=Symbiodinium natans TaxID=878477 RepID=A0A812Q990_9DINO|nr:unnamed protein product [Symbiodinium natans]